MHLPRLVSGTKRVGPASHRPAQASPPRSVLLVGHERDWPPELKASLRADGYLANTVPDLALAPPLTADGGVGALFLRARPLGASELLVLRSVREASPGTAIVVVTRDPSDPDLKRAFESGATAFLSWPASPDSLRHAIGSGAAQSGAGGALRS